MQFNTRCTREPSSGRKDNTSFGNTGHAPARRNQQRQDQYTAFDEAVVGQHASALQPCIHSFSSRPYNLLAQRNCHSGIVWTACSTLLLIRSGHRTTVLPGHSTASHRGDIISKPNRTRRSDIPFRDHREATLTQCINPLYRQPPSGKAASHQSPVTTPINYSLSNPPSTAPQNASPNKKHRKSAALRPGTSPGAIHLPWCHPPPLGHLPRGTSPATSISQFAAGGANDLRYLGAL